MTVTMIYNSGGKILTCHSFTVQLYAQQPRRDPADVEVGHLIVNVHEFLIFLDDAAHRIGVVVNGGVRGHFSQSRVLETAQNILIKNREVRQTNSPQQKITFGIPAFLLFT